MKRAITLIVISGILLFLSSCIFFQTINQPSVSTPNAIVSVTIIANTQGGSNEPYFGVCLPIGWTIPGDSVRCGGAYEEVIYYDTLITSWQESVSPAPSGYYWWAGKGIPDETAVGNVFANLKIQTDSQLGIFSIDYMLGDGYNGVNYQRSNGHLIEITTDPTILLVNPEEGYQNFQVNASIIGINTHFSDGTGTENVWLTKDSNEIYSNSFTVNSNTSIDANFSIPLTAPIGLWDVKVETDMDGIITKADGFNIHPSPPIVIVNPNSLVVGVLPGTIRTKTITISNEGEGDLYFDIVGGFSSTNYALQFDGNDDYAEIPDDLSLQISENITMECWIRFEAGGTYQPRIISKGPDGSGYELLLTNSNEICNLEQRVQPGALISRNTLIAGNWYHVASVYDGSYLKIYINGILDTLVTANGYLSISDLNLYIGQKSTGDWDKYKGVIDEVRIWNIARSENDIQEYMHQQLTGSEPGLVAYWQFDEGEGTEVFDKTSNANDGILLGGINWLNSITPILPGWFFVECDSGICTPHSSMEVELLFDATEVDTGDYYASVIVKSNDPFTPSVIVPIHMIVSSNVGVENEINIPLVFKLEQNYPNPFNPATIIKYSIPELSKVKLTLFNLLGEEVTTLVNEEKNAGNYSVEFNASALPSGVYFYQLKAGDFVQTKKMILMK